MGFVRVKKWLSSMSARWWWVSWKSMQLNSYFVYGPKLKFPFTFYFIHSTWIKLGTDVDKSTEWLWVSCRLTLWKPSVGDNAYFPHLSFDLVEIMHQRHTVSSFMKLGTGKFHETRHRKVSWNSAQKSFMKLGTGKFHETRHRNVSWNSAQERL
jgi:DNA modification methylase